ncbi:MAG: hypothetical protein ACI85O_001447 [Saprospiraceae bacterium]|jgi:hypothetical protein
MKSKIYFLTLFTIFLFTQIHAQKGQLEYGISLSPSLVFNESFDRSPAANYSVGLFFNYNVTNRIGIAGGIEYQQMNLNTLICVPNNIGFPNFFPFCDEIPSVDAFQLTKFPLWTRINLNDNMQAKSQFFLILGYALGKINDAKNSEEFYNLPGLVSTVHFGKIGLETKRKVNERMQITGGLHLDMTNIYDAKYGQVNMLGLILRFGFI